LRKFPQKTKNHLTATTVLMQKYQIPGSHCVPLHEVDRAFELDPVTFEETYGFKKFDPTLKNVVLTCRSGRRVKVADA
jgi:rhodanese-related sulfurtransferase